MERRRTKPVRELPETIHSLLGLKSHLTSAWVKSVCNIVKNVSSSSDEILKEEYDSAFDEIKNIKELYQLLLYGLSPLLKKFWYMRVTHAHGYNKMMDPMRNVFIVAVSLDYEDPSITKTHYIHYLPYQQSHAVD